MSAKNQLLPISERPLDHWQYSLIASDALRLPSSPVLLKSKQNQVNKKDYLIDSKIVERERICDN